MSLIPQCKCNSSHFVCSREPTIPVPRAHTTCSGLLAARASLYGMLPNTDIHIRGRERQFEEVNLALSDIFRQGLRLLLQQAGWWQINNVERPNFVWQYFKIQVMCAVMTTSICDTLIVTYEAMEAHKNPQCLGHSLRCSVPPAPAPVVGWGGGRGGGWRHGWIRGFQGPNLGICGENWQHSKACKSHP